MNSIDKRITTATENLDFDNVPLPNTIKLELSSICNHHCLNCKTSIEKNNRCAFMSSEIFEKAIQQAKELNIKEVGLYYMGESLLDKNIVDRLKYIKANTNMFTYLTTNGTILEPMKELVANGIDSLKFSINAINREQHKQLTKVDDFDLTISNLKELIKYRNEKHYKTEISVSCLYDEKTDQTDFLEELKDIADGVVRFYVHSHTGVIKINQKVSESKDIIDSHKFPCFSLVKIIHILSNGDINMCKWGNKDFVIGNLSTLALKDAWYSDKAQIIRKKHINKEICQNCIGIKGIL